MASSTPVVRPRQRSRVRPAVGPRDQDDGYADGYDGRLARPLLTRYGQDWADRFPGIVDAAHRKKIASDAYLISAASARWGRKGLCPHCRPNSPVRIPDQFYEKRHDQRTINGRGHTHSDADSCPKCSTMVQSTGTDWKIIKPPAPSWSERIGKAGQSIAQFCRWSCSLMLLARRRQTCPPHKKKSARSGWAGMTDWLYSPVSSSVGREP